WVVSLFAVHGATDCDACRFCGAGVLARQLRSGDVVIWDNLKPLQSRQVVAAVEGTGAQVLPAPPWSPDLIPIEKLFSKIKGVLKTLAARTPPKLMAALGAALGQVCAQDIVGWFRSCGLALD